MNLAIAMGRAATYFIPDGLTAYYAGLSVPGLKATGTLAPVVADNGFPLETVVARPGRVQALWRNSGVADTMREAAHFLATRQPVRALVAGAQWAHRSLAYDGLLSVALGRIYSSYYDGLFDMYIPVYLYSPPAAARAIAELGENYLDHAIHRILATDQMTLWMNNTPENVVRQFGDAAVPILQRIISQEPLYRDIALRALFQMKTKATEQAIAQLLESEDENVRFTVACQVAIAVVQYRYQGRIYPDTDFLLCNKDLVRRTFALYDEYLRLHYTDFSNLELETAMFEPYKYLSNIPSYISRAVIIETLSRLALAQDASLSLRTQAARTLFMSSDLLDSPQRASEQENPILRLIYLAIHAGSHARDWYASEFVRREREGFGDSGVIAAAEQILRGESFTLDQAFAT